MVTLLLLAACATAPAPPADRVAGCWIDDARMTTMRWLPDRERTGVLVGEWAAIGPGADASHKRYELQSLTPTPRLCELSATHEADRCWVVAEGQGGSLEGGRAFVDAYRDRVRISVVGDGPERVIFHGRRDGCD
jgi:hypothetical protein